MGRLDGTFEKCWSCLTLPGIGRGNVRMTSENRVIPLLNLNQKSYLYLDDWKYLKKLIYQMTVSFRNPRLKISEYRYYIDFDFLSICISIKVKNNDNDIYNI